MPHAAYLALLPRLKPVTLVFGDILYESGGRMADVYFPERSVVSLLTVVDDHAALEVGFVGRDGMVGTPLALGVDISPVRALVQGEGSALRMSAAAFRTALKASPSLQKAAHNYVHLLMTQIMLTAGCNQFHPLDVRLARWLLMTRDRLVSPEFRLTQAFLADMLGVRRVGVTEAATALQERGLIRYTRGNISILDDAGLQAAACSCYRPLNGSRR